MNSELQQKQGIRSNRYCWRRTFEAQGLPHISRLALANCRDLLPLVEWNAARGIHFFRIPSALFPWSHEYELEQLPGGWRGGLPCCCCLVGSGASFVPAQQFGTV